MFIFLITHMNQRRKFSLYNHTTPQVTASNNAPRNSAAAFSASEWPVSESASRPLYTWLTWTVARENKYFFVNIYGIFTYHF